MPHTGPAQTNEAVSRGGCEGAACCRPYGAGQLNLGVDFLIGKRDKGPINVTGVCDNGLPRW